MESSLETKKINSKEVNNTKTHSKFKAESVDRRRGDEIVGNEGEYMLLAFSSVGRKNLKLFDPPLLPTTLYSLDNLRPEVYSRQWNSISSGVKKLLLKILTRTRFRVKDAWLTGVYLEEEITEIWDFFDKVKQRYREDRDADRQALALEIGGFINWVKKKISIETVKLLSDTIIKQGRQIDIFPEKNVVIYEYDGGYYWSEYNPVDEKYRRLGEVQVFQEPRTISVSEFATDEKE